MTGTLTHVTVVYDSFRYDSPQCNNTTDFVLQEVPMSKYPCAIPGCHRPLFCRWLCREHYQASRSCHREPRRGKRGTGVSPVASAQHAAQARQEVQRARQTALLNAVNELQDVVLAAFDYHAPTPVLNAFAKVRRQLKQ